MAKNLITAGIVRKAILLLLLAASLYTYFYPDTLARPLAAHKRKTLNGLFREQLATRYFVFHSNVSREKVEDFGRTCDLFIDLFNRDFFEIKYKFPIHVYILPDAGKFQDFLRNAMGAKTIPEGLMGAYLSGYRALVTHQNAGWGTFTHEILHPLVDSSLPAVPSWAVEGIPAFAERFYGYEKDRQLRVQWGYPNPWRIQELEGRLARLDLSEIVSGAQNVSEASLVSLFIYRQGKWKYFLDLVQRNEKHGYPTFLEAALEKPLAEIEPAWRKFLNDLEGRKPEIYRLPASNIYRTESEYIEAINNADLLYLQN